MAVKDTGGGKRRRGIRRADPTTIHAKVLVGYQGWFTCAGDGTFTGLQEWQHWFNHRKAGRHRLATDLWPDVSEYPPSELFPVPGMKHRSGHSAHLFSSRHPQTVQRHFHYMAQHGIDGAFLHRFVGQVDQRAGNLGGLYLRDEVGRHVREAAEAEERVFAIMYDVSGVPPERVQGIVERDWTHLIEEEGILESPSYLREGGRPVVGLFGLGFADRGHSPELVRSLTTFIRNATSGGAYIVAGTPSHWRTSDCDADSNQAFVDVWLNDVDAISPWTVGRYRAVDEADQYFEDIVMKDIELLTKRNEVGKSRHVDYIPVVLPGASGYNMSSGRWRYNDIKRDGGNFLWRQIYNAYSQKVQTLYAVSWDEYDEGTALMPALSERRFLPTCDSSSKLMALDEDGYDLPPDWYMRICGLAADALHEEWNIRELFPFDALRTYWTNHPKLEPEQEQLQLATESSCSSLVPEGYPPPYSSQQSIVLSHKPVRLRYSASSMPYLPPPGRPLPQIPPLGLEPTPPSPQRRSPGSDSSIAPVASTSRHSRSPPTSSAIHLQDDRSTRADSPILVNEDASSVGVMSITSSYDTLIADVFTTPGSNSSMSSDSGSVSSHHSQTKQPGRLSRLLSGSRKGKEPQNDTEANVNGSTASPPDPKTLKAEEKRRKKEETKARREKLAYDLKMRAKADSQARAAAKHVHPSRGNHKP